MKRFLSLCTLLLALPLAAQITPERLAADPSLATDVYHVYDYSPSRLTKAPRGYKPVYISHYGRHGERYINREEYLYPGLEVLQREALTPLGEKALYLTLSEIVFTGRSISKDRLFLKYKRYLLHICDRIAMLVRK